jgi:uncharacterized membrane protein YhiD involved in acid resistance
MMLARSDIGIFLLAGFVVAVSVMAGLWLLFGTSFYVAMIVGLLIILLVLGYVHSFTPVLTEQEAKEHDIRARVAKIDTQIDVRIKEKHRLRAQLDELASHPGREDTNDWLIPENDLLNQLAELDREIEPKRKKRAQLKAEFDELLQKKGYRG